MHFVKMHGIGNDFVLLDLIAGAAGLEPEAPDEEWQGLARRMCDRHFGVGSDGLLLLLPSLVADVRMRIFNPDGSEAESCGNGIRCLARYFRERVRNFGARLTIETIPGVAHVQFIDVRGEVHVRVDMGLPGLSPRSLPATVEASRMEDFPLSVQGTVLSVTGVSMGNPHVVAFVDRGELDSFPLQRIGPLVEHHSLFPRRTNFEVVELEGKHLASARVWERGAGATLACGTGACAVGVASILRGVGDSTMTVRLPGGELTVEWDGAGSVFMTGPAEYVFEGKWLLD